MKLIMEAYSLTNKTGDFFRLIKERQNNVKLDLSGNQIRSLEFQIRLDSEEKHHSAVVYGIIDAIGTLGGVHDIVLWCVMFIYGSLRKNVYLFSIINCLIRTEQLKDTTPQQNDEQRDDNQIQINAPDQVSRQNANRLNNDQNQNYTPVRRSETGLLPRMF